MMRRIRESVSNHLAVYLVSGALVVGGAYYYQVVQEKQRATCQVSYNKAFATQLTERSRLSVASDDAKTDLLRGITKLILAPKTTNTKAQEKRAAAFLKLFREFDAASVKVEKDRAATPLPTIPNC